MAHLPSSYACAREALRSIGQEELFIRTPDGMVPTPRADQLAALYAGR
jgi:hypothetical protein